ncbi:MAG: hypothetical protein AAB534_00875 [Patescibacteria group bacterium]
MQRINRKAHVGKSSNEKEAYKNFLSQRFSLDKTEEDPENPSKTDSSNFDSEERLSNIKSRGKSWKLKIGDFFQNNWVVSLGTGLILFVIGLTVSFAINQGVQEEKISGMETRVGKVEGKVDSLTTTVGELNTNISTMQTGFNKDIEFIKDKLSGRK